MTVTNDFEGSRLFLNIPASVAHDPRFKSDKSILLYGEIYSMINVTGTFFMSTKKIAERLRCSRTTVINCINELKSLGYIDTKMVEGKNGETKGRQISLTRGAQRTALPPYSSLDPGGTAHLTQIEQVNRTTNKTDINSPAKPDPLAEQCREVIEYLNQKTGKKFNGNAKGNREAIYPRLKEGYTVDDLKLVIDNMSKAWTGTTFSNGQPGENYLKPDTLFRASKIEGYMNYTTKNQGQKPLITNEERDGHFG